MPVLVLVLSIVYSVRLTPLFAYGRPAESFTLSNGVKVILKDEPYGNLAAVELAVGAGSADEEPAEAGLAHVVEHILFRGSAGASGTKLAGEIEGLGARMNAFTSRDQTVFHVVLPAQQITQGLKLLAQMIHLPKPDQAQLPKEIQVVLQEWKQAQDDPASRATTSLFNLVYGNHPYGRPVLGTPESLKQISWRNVTRFYNLWYVANNMTLIVVGNFAAGLPRGEIERLFSPLRQAPIPPRHRPDLKVQSEPRIEITRTSAIQARLLIGFPIPPAVEPQIPRLDLLAYILGGGESSRLARTVKYEQRLVNAVSASSSPRRGPGVFIVRAETEPRTTDDALKAILREVYRLREQSIEPPELNRTVANFMRFFVESKETVQRHARQLGRFQRRHGTPNYEETYLNTIRAVTPDSLKETAQAFLKSNQLSVALVLPERTGTSLDTSRIQAMGHEIEKSLDTFARRGQDQVVSATLENGLRIVIQEDSKLPLVALHAASKGGLVDENERNNGIHNFIITWLAQGSSQRSSPGFVHEIEELAGTMNGSTGFSAVNFFATFPERELIRGLDLFLGALFRARFSEDSLERTRQDILRRIANDGERVRSKVMRLFYQTLFSAHPYQLPALGQRDVVASISRQELVDRYQRLFSPDRTVVAIVGRVNGEKLLTHIRERLSSFQPHGSKAVAPQRAFPTEETRAQKQNAKTHQAHVVLGFLGPTKREEDYFPMKVTEAILSDMGGRLFKVLRDEKGLAYAAGAFALDDPWQGAFAVYAATDPQKVEEIKQGFLLELGKLQHAEVSEDELSRAKNYLLGNFEIGRQTNRAKAADLALNYLFDLGSDPQKRFRDGIERVTAASVRSFALKYFTLDRYTLAVVGP